MVDPEIAPEGPTSEWKEVLPRPERLARTLAAFANGGGGVLWIGVRDGGERVGLAAPRTALESLEQALDCVEPRPEIQLRRHPGFPRGPLLEVTVRAGEDGPAGALATCGTRIVYVRDGSSSRPATAADLRALERRPAGRRRLDDKSAKLLRLLASSDGATLPELAKRGRMGRRAVRRLVVQLTQHGLVLERDGGRFGLSPHGHRALR